MIIDKNTIILILNISNEKHNKIVDVLITHVFSGQKLTSQCYTFKYASSILEYDELICFLKFILSNKDQAYVFDLNQGQLRSIDIRSATRQESKIESAVNKVTTILQNIKK